MFLSRLGKKERYIAYIAVFIAGAVIFDKLVLGPILKRLKDLNITISRKEKELNNALQIIAQKENINSTYQEYSKDIMQKLSDQKETAQLLSEIEKIAKKTGVSLIGMKPSQVKENKFHNEYIVQIEAEADVSSLVDFLYKLERTSKLIRVGEFRLAAKQKSGNTLKMDMVVKSITIVPD